MCENPDQQYVNFWGSFNQTLTLEAPNARIEDLVEDGGFVFHPNGVAARVHSLEEQARRNQLDPKKLKQYLGMASSTEGKPGNYRIVHDGVVYKVRIKGETFHDGARYGLLTSIARY